MEDYSSFFLAGQRITRLDYVAACQDIGIKPALDDDLGGYGDRFGCFYQPEYNSHNPEHVHLALRQARWYSICDEARNEPELAPEPEPEPERIKMLGQIWEPCSCGREPVYMPLMLCERCWPIIEPRDAH